MAVQNNDSNSVNSLIALITAKDVLSSGKYLESPSAEMQKAAEIIRANPELFQAIRDIAQKIESTDEEVSSILRGSVLMLATIQDKLQKDSRNQVDLTFITDLFTNLPNQPNNCKG